MSPVASVTRWASLATPIAMDAPLRSMSPSRDCTSVADVPPTTSAPAPLRSLSAVTVRSAAPVADASPSRLMSPGLVMVKLPIKVPAALITDASALSTLMLIPSLPPASIREVSASSIVDTPSPKASSAVSVMSPSAAMPPAMSINGWLRDTPVSVAAIRKSPRTLRSPAAAW